MYTLVWLKERETERGEGGRKREKGREEERKGESDRGREGKRDRSRESSGE